MSSRTDEPQPRHHLNHPRFTKFGNPWRHVDEDVDRAAGRLGRGRRGQDLVMPAVSAGKGRTLALRKSPGGSHDDSGFMAWHVNSDSGNGKRFRGIFAMRRLYIQRTLDREHLDILCSPWSPSSPWWRWLWFPGALVREGTFCCVLPTTACLSVLLCASHPLCSRDHFRAWAQFC